MPMNEDLRKDRFRGIIPGTAIDDPVAMVPLEVIRFVASGQKADVDDLIRK